MSRIIRVISTIIISIIILNRSIIVTGNEKLSEYDKNVQDAMNYCYLNSYDNVKTYMKENDYHIIFLKEDEKICDMEEYKDNINSIALIDYKTHRIYISYTDVETMEINLFHEIGHMIDSKYSFISETNNFNKIWKQRYEFFSHFNFDTTYYEENRRECFAQMYAIFKKYPEWQRENFPEIFEYFNNL